MRFVVALVAHVAYIVWDTQEQTMDLHHITITKCPTCGALPVAEEIKTSSGKVRRHCNGEQWETRRFACGARVEWVPNFSSEFIKGACANDPKRIVVHDERQAARDKVKRYIKRLRIDSEYKGRLIRAMDTWDVRPEHCPMPTSKETA